MKSFKNFIVSEEVDLTANVERGVMDVHDHAVRNNVNAFLNGELGCNVVTPYVALNKINKVLANFHIFLPKAPYMEDDQGVHVFKIKQFGKVAGMRNDGSVVTKVEEPYSLYFEWKRNERGMYDVFAEVVTDEELTDLLDEVEKDVNDEKLDEAVDKKKLKAEVAKHEAIAGDNPRTFKQLQAKKRAFELKRLPKVGFSHDAVGQMKEAEDAIGKIIKNDQDRKSMDKLVDKKAIRPFADTKAYPGEGSDSGKPFTVKNKIQEEEKTQGQLLADLAKKKRDEAKRKRKLLGLDEVLDTRDKVHKYIGKAATNLKRDTTTTSSLKEALVEAAKVLKKKN